jgi:hypothetical protein
MAAWRMFTTEKVGGFLMGEKAVLDQVLGFGVFPA